MDPSTDEPPAENAATDTMTTAWQDQAGGQLSQPGTSGHLSQGSKRTHECFKQLNLWEPGN